MARQPKLQVVDRETCENCLYGIAGDIDHIVVCRRYPPLITKVEGNSVTSHSPVLRPDWWCGEWKVKVSKTVN